MNNWTFISATNRDYHAGKNLLFSDLKKQHLHILIPYLLICFFKVKEKRRKEGRKQLLQLSRIIHVFSHVNVLVSMEPGR